MAVGIGHAYSDSVLEVSFGKKYARFSLIYTFFSKINLSDKRGKILLYFRGHYASFQQMPVFFEWGDCTDRHGVWSFPTSGHVGKNESNIGLMGMDSSVPGDDAV